MDDMGFGSLDGEEYIEAVRAGAHDPHGFSADELQEQLDAFDEEWAERLRLLPEEQLDAVIAGRIPLPPLPKPVESAALERVRHDEAFVRQLRSIEARAGRLEAERRALLAEHVTRVMDLPGDTGVSVRELAAMAAVELRQSQRSIMTRMTDAHTVVTELRAAHDAAAAGRITIAHLRVIEQQTRPMRFDARLTEADRAAVVDALVELAEELPTTRLRAKAKQVINDRLTEPLQVRHDFARQQRSVSLFDAGDGMGQLNVYGPLVELSAAYDRLNQAARGKDKDDPRTFDQFRTDAVLELLLAGVSPEDLHGTAGITGQVWITIPATELLHGGVAPDDPATDSTSLGGASPNDGDGIDDTTTRLGTLEPERFPALLNGTMLVDTATARWFAAGLSMWQRLFTDPLTGMPIAVDSYRPTKAQRDWLAARDMHCRSPWCSLPAHRSDVDHTDDWALGGTTSIDNLEFLCRGDHVLRHNSRWQIDQLPGGVIRWTSPIGQVILDRPEPAGPIFTDMPRSKQKPPKPSAAQRRLDRQRVEEEMAAQSERYRQSGLESDRPPWLTGDFGFPSDPNAPPPGPDVPF